MYDDDYDSNYIVCYDNGYDLHVLNSYYYDIVLLRYKEESNVYGL